MSIEIKGGEVFLDGVNAGRVVDVKLNYPQLADEIDALVAAQEQTSE